MLPVLFSLGPFTIYSFGFFLGIGFFMGAFLIWRRLRDLGFKEEKIIDGIIFLTFCGLVFSRLFFIFRNFDKFGFLIFRWILIRQYPGFSFWGGVMGVNLGLVWFCRLQKWNFWRVADEAAFGILPFLFFSQLGSFFDGSDPGGPTGMPWGIFFPGSLVRQHPTSLFMAIFIFLIWIFLLRIEKEWRSWEWYKSKAPGFINLSFWSLLLLVNFLLAFLKDSGLYFKWIEIILSLGGAGASGLLLWFRRK